MSVNINLSSVLVFGPHTLKVVRVHPEHEIICKYRVIILENSSNLSLVLSFEVQSDRLVLRKVVGREEMVKAEYVKLPCYRPYCGCSAVLFALE